MLALNYYYYYKFISKSFLLFSFSFTEGGNSLQFFTICMGVFTISCRYVDTPEGHFGDFHFSCMFN